MKFKIGPEMPLFMQSFATVQWARRGPLGCTMLTADMQSRSCKSGRFEDPLSQMLCGPRETTIKGKYDVRARNVVVIVGMDCRRRALQLS